MPSARYLLGLACILLAFMASPALTSIKRAHGMDAA